MKIGANRATSARSDDDNLVPLINVVFLMLVFFMVAGQIKKADPIKVNPPTSINETRAKTDPNVVIVVGQNNQIYLDDDPVSVEKIRPYLENAFSESQDKGAFWVQVKADGAIAVDKLRPVFNQIRLSGLTKVSLATQLARGHE